MLAIHIIFNGQCYDAIELYKNVFNATVKEIIYDDKRNQVIHAEMLIHDQLVMLNDFGDQESYLRSGGYQLCVRFDNKKDLYKAYNALEADSKTITPLQPTDYSPCIVRFIDKFDVRWAFWV